MRMNEVLNQEEMLRTIEMIFHNTISQIRNSSPLSTVGSQAQTLPSIKQAPKPPVVKQAKAKKIPKAKKALYAAPPKPLPKPKPQPTSMAKANDLQQKQLAGYIGKAISDKHKGMMPNSLKPLPTSVLSPVDSIDKDKAEKFELAKRNADMSPPKLDKDWVLNHKNGYLP